MGDKFFIVVMVALLCIFLFVLYNTLVEVNECESSGGFWDNLSVECVYSGIDCVEVCGCERSCGGGKNEV